MNVEKGLNLKFLEYENIFLAIFILKKIQVIFIIYAKMKKKPILEKKKKNELFIKKFMVFVNKCEILVKMNKKNKSLFIFFLDL